jgi:catechol 2,3-dioxygenase-like lactoylglutathione lyase family enzyme
MKQPEPVRTFGLTHVALAVRDPERSARFYQAVLGSQPIYESPDFVQSQTPGSRDVLVFERRRASAGRTGGIAHFGFRLKRPADIEAAVRAVLAAGGRVLKQGEFVPGEPFVFFEDPDGYEVEIWYEIPTRLDPKRVGSRPKKRNRQALMSRLNASWHAAHRMPAKPTLDQRVEWHQAHADACGCREIPRTVRAELSRRGVAVAPRTARRQPKAR